MRRKDLKSLILVTALLAAAAGGAQAQPMMGAGGGGKMPDLSQIVGRPLPDRGMPIGTVSVRVAPKTPANAVADVEVSAIIKNAGGDARRRTRKTDESGRVLFEGMTPGDEFLAEVTVDGEHLQTEKFSMPAQGGLRTMLIAAVASGGGDSGGEALASGTARDGKDQRAFALGATAGAAEPDDALPTGTL